LDRQLERLFDIASQAAEAQASCEFDLLVKAKVLGERCDNSSEDLTERLTLSLCEDIRALNGSHGK
jgi:hypothetical protein